MRADWKKTCQHVEKEEDHEKAHAVRGQEIKSEIPNEDESQNRRTTRMAILTAVVALIAYQPQAQNLFVADSDTGNILKLDPMERKARLHPGWTHLWHWPLTAQATCL